jgi:asparagine synthase (glutamine-hydrolysing)
MCGIAGFFDRRALSGADEARACVARMTDTMTHRGPDDSGVWVDAEAGIALGHRRLSIIDLSPSGHQPMASADGRFVITYNGEVYNFPDLRAELEALGHAFRGSSDTEVMLAAFTAWGIEDAVRRFFGMFAFAVWDRQTRSLSLVRDRLGVKPLYWSLRDGLLLFGSELKALMAHPEWRAELDTEAVAAFIRHSYVPGPATIFRNVHKLVPGTILTLDASGEPRLAAYWSLRAAIEHGAKWSAHRSEKEAAEQLEWLLRDAVRRRMIADVPLGAFLSGGIDSSTVVALMQAQSNAKVRTFTIGFEDKNYDEARHAKFVAKHVASEHTELYVSARETLEVVPRLPDWFDEPFADSSQIPTFLVSAMTRAHVTVALSGDGGDELFAGYPRYMLAESLWRRIARAPASLRRAVGLTLARIPEPVLDRLAKLLPPRLRSLNFGRKLHRLASLVQLPVDDALHAELVAVWPEERFLVPGTSGALQIAPDPQLAALLPDFLARMQYYDTLSYLPDDILVKVDRCSMAVALEARQPLLDHRLVEFVWSLPREFKVRNGETKWLLRRVLHRYVPRALVERPKMGFSVPLAEWLRGPLRDWARELIAPGHLVRQGLFAVSEVERLWSEHQNRQANRESVLWNILMFQAWNDRYRIL